MRSIRVITAGLVLSALATGADAQARISILSEWGQVSATLGDNQAAQALLKALPVTVEMSDHLRQEKTGSLSAPLPHAPRQQDFAKGTLGLWGPDHFVIYYRSGRVPQPGIVVLGQVTGDVSIFDRPGTVTVRIERVD